MLVGEIRGSRCLEVPTQFDCRLSSVVGDTPSVPQKSLKIPLLPQELTRKGWRFSRVSYTLRLNVGFGVFFR